MPNSRLAIIAAALLLVGCALPDPPPPDPGNPASPLALEAPVRRMNHLNSDKITSQTRQLLRQAQKENEQQNQDQNQGGMKMDH